VSPTSHARSLVAASAFPLLAGCLSYSPLDENVGERNLNLAAVANLTARPAPEVLRFAVVGDVQGAFDDAADAVRALGGVEGLAFVIQVGDFTDLGLAQEYELMIEVFDGLEVPWLVVIGNHDQLGNGRVIYERAFGPRNLAFTWAGTRFVILDTNTVEYGNGSGVPDLSWLGAALAEPDGHARTVVFAHIWPWSSQFDPALQERYLILLSEERTAAALYGHDHRYQAADAGGVHHVTAEHVSSRRFLLVEDGIGGALAVRRVSF
jgi:3',5'-cyclic AMP phosphodiesterase CpdA